MTETTTRTINLMPEPGTPAYENLRQWMRGMYADPRQVSFRAGCRSDAGTMAFLTQGDSEPLPEVVDPVRDAVEVKVTLLLEGSVGDEDAEYRLLREVEDALRGQVLGHRAVIDVLLPEEPHGVQILSRAHYREGDHFTNPINTSPIGGADGA